MHSEFIKEVQIMDLDENQKNSEILNSIKHVKETLNNIYNNMQFADSDLIDYYSYQIKAEESKYNYLIKQAKKRKLNILK